MQMLPAKTLNCALHGWQITQKVKIVENNLIQAKKLRSSHKKDERLPSFTCLIIIILTNRQTDRQKNKRGLRLCINRYLIYLQTVIIDGPIAEVIGLSAL